MNEYAPSSENSMIWIVEDTQRSSLVSGRDVGPAVNTLARSQYTQFVIEMEFESIQDEAFDWPRQLLEVPAMSFQKISITNKSTIERKFESTPTGPNQRSNVLISAPCMYAHVRS